MWNAILDGILDGRKEQCASILAYLNKNGIGSWQGPFFQWVRKMRSGNETKLLLWDCPLFLAVQVSVVPLDSSSMSCSYSLTNTLRVAPSGLLATPTSISHNLKYLLFYFHQRTPLDWAVLSGHGKVEAYLKRAADPEMLWVSMWG